MKFLILFLLSFSLAQFDATADQTTYNLRIITNSLSFQTKYGDKITLSVGQMLYKDEDGDVVPTPDSYIVELINGSPKVVDVLYGCCLSLRLANIGDTNTVKLEVFYHSGANAYKVKIYKIDGVDITPFETQPTGSNMGSVELKGEHIIIKNQEINHDDSFTIYTDVYRIDGDQCKFVEEDINRVSNDVTNLEMQ